MYTIRWSLPAICAAVAMMVAYKPPVHKGSDHPSAAESPVSPAAPNEVLVAAAADLRFAMDSLVAIFSRENPDITVRPTYGSSGNFFEQIKNGAPFDLFFSADVDYPRRLKTQNRTASDVHIYATGHLVLWSRSIDPAREKMNTLLDKAVTKIAIANPAHAPYGQRAEESLHFYKLYDKVKDKLIFGENIAQTAQYAQSGAAEVGVIALSLALSPTMQHTGGKYWLIPAEAHQPLLQGYVLLPHSKDNPGANKFALFCGSQTARAILHSFGFGEPPNPSSGPSPSSSSN